MENNIPYSKDLLLEFYRRMLRVRRFEERAADCFTKGMLAGNIHLCIGQEASVVGSCAALRETDYITSTHRGHGHLLAKGAKSDKMMLRNAVSEILTHKSDDRQPPCFYGNAFR